MNLSFEHHSPGSALRVVICGSYYRGFYVLNECLFGPLRERVKVVGVATDDPGNRFISREKRVWQYPHTEAEANMVRNLASSAGIPVFVERVKDQKFRETFTQEWRPDICLMATFGQLIDEPLFTFPRKGFYNFHPYDGQAWPSTYAGANPFAEMIRDGVRTCFIGMHQVDATFDTGTFVARSEGIAIPPGASVTDMHKITSPLVALLARREIERILAACA